MGYIVDYTKPGKEKYRPWLLRMAIPAAIVSAASGYIAGMVIVLSIIPVTNALGGMQEAWIKYGIVCGLVILLTLLTCWKKAKETATEDTGIPVRTLEDWEAGRRTPPEYIPRLIEYQLKYEKLVKSNKKD